VRLFGFEVARIKAAVKAVVLFAVTPHAVASLSLLAGIGLAVAGVYILAGTGWALLSGAAPLLLLAAVLIRGLTRAG
jgi:hypothetical protein